MSVARFALSVGALALALSGAAGAQCPKDVKVTAYGRTCTFFGQPATLAGRYEAARCTLALTQTVARTCCNTFPRTMILMLGATPIDPGLPLPVLVPGCWLSLQPIVLFGQPAASGGVVWQLPLPPIAGPVTFYAQGVNHYFTTIGFTNDFQTTDALRLDAS